MAGKRVYSDAERASAYMALTVNGGNIKKTARDTGLPESTIRGWRTEWEDSGPPPLDLVEEAATDFVDNASRVRDKALAELERKIPDATPSALVATIGMLQDKISMAKGLATSRTETVHALPSADEIRATLGAVFQGALEAAESRQRDIIDAEVVLEIPSSTNG